MALEMKSACMKCEAPLDDMGEAHICSYVLRPLHDVYGASVPELRWRPCSPAETAAPKIEKP